jgi:hypothetical protein
MKTKITDKPNPATRGQRSQLERLQRFLGRHDAVLDADTRAKIITRLETFVADPENDSQTIGMLTRHTVCEFGAGDKWIGFRRSQVQSLLADLKGGGPTAGSK